MKWDPSTQVTITCTIKGISATSQVLPEIKIKLLFFVLYEYNADTFVYCERAVSGRVYSQWLLKAANQCFIIAHSQEKSVLD